MLTSVRTHGRPRGLSEWVTFVLLNALVTKPLSVFVYWLSDGKNTTRVHARRGLLRALCTARLDGRPVLFASNHLSMFDDPIIPMALYRLGPRTLGELAVLSVLVIAALGLGPSTGGGALFITASSVFFVWAAAFGTDKCWWSMGDLVNFTTSAALEARLTRNGQRELSSREMRVLAIAGWLIRGFMTSPVVKTVFVDRRSGEDAKRTRARSLALAVEIAAEGQPLWVFVEGGRSRNPDEIQPARRGIGELVVELRRRGLVPLVIAVHHRGLEKVLPIGSPKLLARGSHAIDVRWSELSIPPVLDDPQAIADGIRAGLVALQMQWLSLPKTSSGGS